MQSPFEPKSRKKDQPKKTDRAAGSEPAVSSGMPVYLAERFRVQTKLATGSLADPAEQEADRASTAPGAIEARAQPGVAADLPVHLDQQITSIRGGGTPLPSALRRAFEPRFGSDLSGVRIHTDSRADATARQLGALAFTTGNDIGFRTGRYAPDTPAGNHVLSHELTHVVQQRTAGSGFVVQRMIDGMTSADMAEYRREQAKRAREIHEKWEKSHQQQFGPELSSQSATLADERTRTSQSLIAQRNQVFQSVGAAGLVAPKIGWMAGTLALASSLPPDLQQRWNTAKQATIVVQAEVRGQSVSFETQERFRPVFSGYLQALLEFAGAMERSQAERQAREDKDYQQRLSQWQSAKDITMSGPRDLGEGAFRGSWALMNPRPEPGYHAPEPVSPGIRQAMGRADAADDAGQWQDVLNDFDHATGWMDNFLLYILPETSEARQGFEYYRDLGTRLETLEKEHPLAVRIPAVFYPRDKFVQTQDEKGGMVEIAQGIPWQFYLYHTGVSSYDKPATSGGEWVLVDMTSPSQMKANRKGSSDFDAVRLQQGDIVDPPLELFEDLNSRLRFPKGQLYWTAPTGKRWMLETTEPWSLSDWLKHIAMALGAIALIVGTAGMGTLAVAAGLAAGAVSIAGTAVSLEERRKHGMLTQADINQAIFSIAIDLIGMAALGLGRIASASAQAARASGVVGRYYFLLQGASKVATGVALAGDVVQVGTATTEFIHAWNAIRNNPNMTDAERDRALTELITTSLLTAGLLVVSMRGNVHELRSGNNVHISDVDPEGRLVIGEGETPAVPHTEAEGAAKPGTDAAAGTAGTPGQPGTPKEGWSKRGLLAPEPGPPKVDPHMPEKKVEIRITRDETGLVTSIEVWHGSGAHPSDIKVHERIAGLIRRYGGQLGRIPKALESLRRAFGGNPPPLELQMELNKLRLSAASHQERLASGQHLSAAEIQQLEAQLHLIEHEIGNVEKAIADPALRVNYPEGKVGLPVKPTDVPNLPDPPAGHHYYLSPHSGRWELRRNPGFSGPRFDVEYVDGKPTGRASNSYEVETRLKNRLLDADTRQRLQDMGYRIDSNGVIYRPAGHGEPGKPHMQPLEVDAGGRIQVSTTESLAEQQSRIRSTLNDQQTKNLQAAEGALAKDEKLRLVEGIHDTGATWAQVLTPARRVQLRNLLAAEGVPKADIDRLIDGLVNNPGTLKVVLGTDPVRGAHPYRTTAGTAAPGVEIHHGNPLYLGGGHEVENLFGLAEAPHDALHRFFEGLTLPSGQSLQPSAIQNAVKANLRPGAAIVSPDGTVRYVFLDQSVAGATAAGK